MGKISGAMDAAVIQVATPDQTAFAELRGYDGIRVWFAPGYHAYATEDRVCDKFSQLGRLLWTARKKHYYRAKSEAFRQEIRGESAPRTPQHAEYRERRDSLIGEGTSFDGSVSVTAIGMFSWSVRLEPGAFATLTEHSLCEAAAQAAQAATRDYVVQLRALNASRA